MDKDLLTIHMEIKKSLAHIMENHQKFKLSHKKEVDKYFKSLRGKQNLEYIYIEMDRLKANIEEINKYLDYVRKDLKDSIYNTED
jgi:hypothetical protein